jgi:hypothetical protein
VPEVRHEAGRRVARHGVGSTSTSATTDHEHQPHGEHHHGEQAHGAQHGDDAGGIEWEDDMLELNRRTTRRTCAGCSSTATRRGQPRDRVAVTVGDRVKAAARQRDGLGPSDAHPFHIHGAGPLRRPRPGRRARGELRLEGHRASSAPARRSTSCSTSPTRAVGWRTATIAEHHESGMMFSFNVEPATRREATRRAPSICSAAPRRPARPRRGSSSRATASSSAGSTSTTTRSCACSPPAGR